MNNFFIVLIVNNYLYIHLFLIQNVCGESGIRTRDTLLAYTRFPGVPLQPLEHLSSKNVRKLRKKYNIQTFLGINMCFLPKKLWDR